MLELLLLPLSLSLPPAAPVLQEDASAEQAEEKPRKPKREGLPEKVEGVLPLEWADALDWRSVGPANMGGRITDIAVNPQRPSEAWIAHATGGLLHTTNRGVTYEHQFTGQRVSSIGSVAVSPSDPSQVWVGTGEANPRNSVSFGNGVYRSMDGGATWDHAGLEEAFQIAEVTIHPADPNTVYVAALGRLWGPSEERGLYKTTDGGESWAKVLEVDAATGVVEIAMHPADPEVLLVATYERERDLYDSNDPAKKWGPGSALWRTADGGASWTRLTDSEGSHGLPSVMLGRIGVDFCRSQPDIAFAVVETERITQEPENAAWLGVRAENAEVGARLTEVTKDSPAAKAGLQEGDILLRFGDTTLVSWDSTSKLLRKHFAGETLSVEVIRDGEAMDLELTLEGKPQEDEDRTDELGYPNAGPFSIGLGGQNANAQDDQGPDGHQYGGIFRSEDGGVTWTRVNSLNPRPMYYSEIRVDPSDPERVYVLGTRLWRSADGGKTFTNDGHGGEVHVDHHALWIDPADGEHMILGNDGGIYVTWDRMESWDHHCHVAIGQFYNVEVGPRDAYFVYGGLQDNGSWGGPAMVRSDSGPVNSDWFSVGGGDGFVVRVDPENPDLVYYESQNGGMGRRDLATGQSGWLRPSAGRGARVRFNWNTPFLLSTHNSGIHYSAGNRVFRSIQRGESSRSISGVITATERGSATALAESRFDPDLLWVGTDDGAVWRTEDGGLTWHDLWSLNEEPAPPAAEAEPEEVPAEPEASPATPAAAPADALTGVWRCTATADGMAPGTGAFTLVLALGAEGAVTGAIESEVGNGALKDGRFDAGEGTLRFAFQPRKMRMDFEARLADGGLAGRLTAATMSFDFTGTREAAEGEAQDAPAEEATDDDAPSGRADAEELQRSAHSKPEKELKDTLDQVLPGRRYVSQLYASHHDRDRVYASFDGHRSNDDAPHAFRSDDRGTTWQSLTRKLPEAAGPVRAIHEDRANPDVLYLGCEFGFFVSADRGASWTRMNGADGLPTVPVHDFAQHPTHDHLVVGTHGRSIWILDVGPLRQASEQVAEADAHLFKPSTATVWRSLPRRAESGTRRFVGENPAEGASFYYSLEKRGRDLTLRVESMDGQVIRELEGSGERGLHRVTWDLRGNPPQDDGGGRRRWRRGRRVDPGTYRVVLEVGGERMEQTFEVRVDPDHPNPDWIRFEEEAEALEHLFGEEEGGQDEES